MNWENISGNYNSDGDQFSVVLGNFSSLIPIFFFFPYVLSTPSLILHRPSFSLFPVPGVRLDFFLSLKSKPKGCSFLPIPCNLAPGDNHTTFIFFRSVSYEISCLSIYVLVC